MKDSIALKKRGGLAYTLEQKALVQRAVAPGSTSDELDLFLYYCQSKGVSALDKMIYCIVRGTAGKKNRSCTFQASIDFLRSVALDSLEYDGQDEPEFGPPVELEYIDTSWVNNKPVEINKTLTIPSWCKMRVYRKGIGRPFVALAHWTEYYPGQKMGFKWRQMPTLMLAKCAEALALRKAFPKKLNQLYAPEEMQHAEIVTEVVEPESFSSTVQSVVEEVPLGPEQIIAPAPDPVTRTKKEGSSSKILTAKETLLKELSEYCMGDEAGMSFTLKDLTLYKDNADGEEKWLEVTDIESAKATWIGQTLRKLRVLVQG